MGASGNSDDQAAVAPTGSGHGDGSIGALATEAVGMSAAGERGRARATLGPGDSIGKYRVIDSLGRGGMGEVVIAEDDEPRRRVAIKVLRAALTDPAASARFLREARAMASLSHPNVIAVHDVGSFGERPFMAMELVEGGTLRDWLARSPRAWQEIVAVFAAAARGLAAAHDAGLVHRDFKPDNVLVGDDGRVKVTDFGLVTAIGEALTVGDDGAGAELSPLTQTGTIMGTPAYMAPEQHRAQPSDARTDQFAFCVALYEALYGEAPFSGQSYEELADNVVSGRRRRSRATHVPARIGRALARGLSADKELRFASMAELLAEIDGADLGGGMIIAAAMIVVVITLVAGTWLGQAQPSPCQQAVRSLADAPSGELVDGAIDAALALPALDECAD